MIWMHTKLPELWGCRIAICRLVNNVQADSAKVEEKLCWCASCGNNVHAECFKRWAGQKGSTVTCVYCRAPWLDGVTGKG